jgi:hypothetical protein
MKTKTKAQYYVIDTDGLDFTPAFKPAGPFDSIEDAEAWLIEDAHEVLENCDEPVKRDECANWSAPSHILKVVKTVRQVPNYELTVRLKTVS